MDLSPLFLALLYLWLTTIIDNFIAQIGISWNTWRKKFKRQNKFKRTITFTSLTNFMQKTVVSIFVL